MHSEPYAEPNARSGLSPASSEPVRPMIFSPAMVALIQRGEKTQTRRLVTPPPIRVLRVTRRDALLTLRASCSDDDPPETIDCPHAVGDVLWIRERWTATFRRSGRDLSWHEVERDERTESLCSSIRYAADAIDMPDRANEWVSPIFMPRWASRLSIRIEDVRAEELQDLSAFDVADEGLPQEISSESPGFASLSLHSDVDSAPRNCSRAAFRERWNRIHARSGPAWEENPWVWVFSFSRC